MYDLTTTVIRVVAIANPYMLHVPGGWPALLPGEPRRHTAIRLIIEHSPALLQLEMSGSAAFQVDGHFALSHGATGWKAQVTCDKLFPGKPEP